MQDVVSFAKDVSSNIGIVEYMRSYFEENFAAYSILGKFVGYDTSSEIDEHGMIVYKIIANEDSELSKLVSDQNGKTIVVYGSTYVINVARANCILMMRFSKIQ